MIPQIGKYYRINNYLFFIKDDEYAIAINEKDWSISLVINDEKDIIDSTKLHEIKKEEFLKVYKEIFSKIGYSFKFDSSYLPLKLKDLK